MPAPSATPAHTLTRTQIYAFERDRRRFATLKTMLAKAGCANVEPINADFLTVAPDDPQYESVTHM